MFANTVGAPAPIPNPLEKARIIKDSFVKLNSGEARFQNIELAASYQALGQSVFLPDARSISGAYSMIIYNNPRSTNSLSVRSADGTLLAILLPYGMGEFTLVEGDSLGGLWTATTNGYTKKANVVSISSVTASSAPGLGGSRGSIKPVQFENGWCFALGQLLCSYINGRINSVNVGGLVNNIAVIPGYGVLVAYVTSGTTINVRPITVNKTTGALTSGTSGSTTFSNIGSTGNFFLVSIACTSATQAALCFGGTSSDNLLHFAAISITGHATGSMTATVGTQNTLPTQTGNVHLAMDSVCPIDDTRVVVAGGNGTTAWAWACTLNGVTYTASASAATIGATTATTFSAFMLGGVPVFLNGNGAIAATVSGNTVTLGAASGSFNVPGVVDCGLSVVIPITGARAIVACHFGGSYRYGTDVSVSGNTVTATGIGAPSYFGYTVHDFKGQKFHKFNSDPAIDATNLINYSSTDFGSSGSVSPCVQRSANYRSSIITFGSTIYACGYGPAGPWTALGSSVYLWANTGEISAIGQCNDVGASATSVVLGNLGTQATYFCGVTTGTFIEWVQI